MLRLRADGEAARRGLPTALLLSWLVATWTAAPAVAQVQLPRPDLADPVVVTAEIGCRWEEGAYEVWVLKGNCRIQQGPDTAASREAALWIERASPLEHGRNKVIAYLEGNVTIDFDRDGARTRLTDQTWLGRFQTATRVQVHVQQLTAPPEEKPPVFQRGIARRRPAPEAAVRRTQYAEYESIPAPAPVEAVPPGARRIRVFPRSDVPIQAQWFPDRQTNQWIAVIDSGVNVLVDGLPEFGAIDVSTDRLVIWTAGMDEPDLTGHKVQAEDVPLEIYMEGNVVFRQGDRVIYADRMYYDVANQIGIVLNAELLTPVANYEGLLRLKSELLRQLGKDRFFAENTFITSSRMGRPGYRIQTQNAYLEDKQRPVFDPRTGTPMHDSTTGEPLVDHQRLATGRNNVLFLGPAPVFYWPFLATDLTEPTFYIRRARVKNDNVFGTQVLTDWNAYQLFSIKRPPAGTEWDVTFDYLSDRGFGLGTTFTYDRNAFVGLDGPTSGLVDYWGIQDYGTDNLGLDRHDVPPEKDYRWRLFWQHRQLLSDDYRLSLEAGWLSDRNFLEEYFEREWDELKDQTTGAELKHAHDNVAWSITADARVNDFFTQTDWLPRADHFWLGGSLFGDRFTVYEHSNVGLARLHVASRPENPVATYHYLPWELAPPPAPPDTPLSVGGERLAIRKEIDWPLQLAAVKVVPYALGEFAHWGEDRTGDDLQRAYWQAGVRASVPFWKVNPDVQSLLWNLDGLAHKVVFDAEFSFAEANRDLTELPLYDPLEDDSIEAFRRRFIPGPPPQLDPRFYALRTGIAGWVTSPTTEIADDLTALRLGMRHRWQTKRGRPGRRQIIDWIVLDTHAVWFPEPLRDNFGEPLGLVDYDFRWHVGDRLTLLSSGGFDFFSQGQQVVTMGGFLERPPRGSLYLGLRLLEGPIKSKVLSMSYTYRMSPKWVSAFGMSVDLGDQGNIGQHFALTRVGESFLISAGASVDASRNNVGAHLAIEPRFLPKTRLGRAGGAQIPVAGAHGLE